MQFFFSAGGQDNLGTIRNEYISQALANTTRCTNNPNNLTLEGTCFIKVLDTYSFFKKIN